MQSYDQVYYTVFCRHAFDLAQIEGVRMACSDPSVLDCSNYQEDHAAATYGIHGGKARHLSAFGRVNCCGAQHSPLSVGGVVGWR